MNDMGMHTLMGYYCRMESSLHEALGMIQHARTPTNISQHYNSDRFIYRPIRILQLEVDTGDEEECDGDRPHSPIHEAVASRAPVCVNRGRWH